MSNGRTFTVGRVFAGLAMLGALLAPSAAQAYWGGTFTFWKKSLKSGTWETAANWVKTKSTSSTTMGHAPRYTEWVALEGAGTISITKDYSLANPACAGLSAQGEGTDRTLNLNGHTFYAALTSNLTSTATLTQEYICYNNDSTLRVTGGGEAYFILSEQDSQGKEIDPLSHYYHIDIDGGFLSAEGGSHVVLKRCAMKGTLQATGEGSVADLYPTSGQDGGGGSGFWPSFIARDGGTLNVFPYASGNRWKFSRGDNASGDSYHGPSFIAHNGGKVLASTGVWLAGGYPRVIATDGGLVEVYGFANTDKQTGSAAWIRLTNGTCRVKGTTFKISNGNYYGVLDFCGDDPNLEITANAASYFGSASYSKLTVNLKPTANWSESVARIRHTNTGANAKAYLYGTVTFNVDVSEFVGKTVSKKFPFLATGSAGGWGACTVPTGAKLVKTGDPNGKIDVSFTQEGNVLYLNVDAQDGGDVASIVLTSPENYATNVLLSTDIKTWMAKTLAQKQTSVTTKETTARYAMEADYASCVKPVTLAWSGTAGHEARVVVTRTQGGAVVFDETTFAATVDVNNLEVGRNYTWTVTCGNLSATGHFYTEANAPRVMNKDFSLIDNCRDLGGWTNTSGKVVKQGMVFRSAAFDWFSGTNADEGEWTIERRPVFSNYWNNVVGLKTEIDLRTASSIADAEEEYQFSGSGFGPGVTRVNPDTASGYPYTAYDFTDANNKLAFKSFFVKFADAAAYPILFHCAEGKDRTGTLAFVLGGLLGMTKTDLETEYALTFYAKSDSRYKTDAWVTLIESRLTAAYPDATYPTIQAKCEQYVKDCGLTAEQVQAVKDLMLEDREAAEQPAAPHDHEYGDWTLTTRPTATAAGLMSRVCTVQDCGHVESRVLPAIGADCGVVHLVQDRERAFLTADLATRKALYVDSTYRNSLLADYGFPLKPVVSWTGLSGEGVFTLTKGGATVLTRTVTGSSTELDNLEIATTYNWTVTKAGATVASGSFTTEDFAPRLIHEPYVLNMRDMGGRVGYGGRRAKQGLVYRTTQFNTKAESATSAPGRTLVDADSIAYLTKTLGIKTDLDLRSASECGKMSASPLGAGVTWVHYAGNYYGGFISGDKTWAKKSLLLLKDTANLPLAFHCVQGKDRTGTLAFLIGGILGFDDDELYKDWEATAFVIASTDHKHAGMFDALVSGVAGYAGATLSERIVNFCLDSAKVGLTQADVDAIRANLLETEVATHVHGFGAIQTLTAATPSMPGIGFRTCSCGQLETVEIPYVNTAETTYTWKNAGSGTWELAANWTASPSTGAGIPGTAPQYDNVSVPATVTTPMTLNVTDRHDLQEFRVYAKARVTINLDGGQIRTRRDLNTDDSDYTSSAHTIVFSGENPRFECYNRGAAGVSLGLAVQSEPTELTFVLPPKGWREAPMCSAGLDSAVELGNNLHFSVDARAMSVPPAGTVVTNVLVFGQDGLRYDNLQTFFTAATIQVPTGAKGALAANDNASKILFLLERDAGATSIIGLTAPAEAAVVPLTLDGHKSYYAQDRDTRWAYMDTDAGREAMTTVWTLPKPVAFAWQGGAAPYTLTVTRRCDGQTFLVTNNLAATSVSLYNFETGRAYKWRVTDANGETSNEGLFLTEYDAPRFIRMYAEKAWAFAQNISGSKSANKVQQSCMPNFRDSGGRLTPDGLKRMKQGKLYRSIEWNRASADEVFEPIGADLYFATNTLGIKTELDLRASDEVLGITIGNNGVSALGPNVRWVHAPMGSYAIGEIGKPEYDALKLMTDASNFPIIYHCFAGQDRTGTLEFFVYAILGLTDEDMMKGWEATAFYQRDTDFGSGRLKTFFSQYSPYGAPGDTMATCVQNALKQKLGLTEADFEAIRANLLETNLEEELDLPVVSKVVVPDPNACVRSWNGTAQTTYLRSNPQYTVAMTANAVDAGNYAVTLTLVNPQVCTWSDGSTGPKTVTFTINVAENSWTSVPTMSKLLWKEGDAPGVLTPGAVRFGAVTATIAKDGGAAQPFDGTVPTAAGTYVLTYTAPADTANYQASVRTRTVKFYIVDPIPGEGYVPVDYVASTASGKQYVDTGLLMQEKFRAELSFEYNALASSYSAMLAGAYTYSSRDYGEYLVATGAEGYWFGGMGRYTGSWEALAKPVAGQRYETVAVMHAHDGEYVCEEFFVDGARDSEDGHKVLSGTPINLYLFARHYKATSDTADRFSNAKLYTCYLYTNETELARCYLPVYAVATGKYGLYDTVRGTFSPSAATTGFVGPSVAQATVPTAAQGLVYDGTEKTGVAGGDGYVVTGGTATLPGDYTATATPLKGYYWSDGTTSAKMIAWTIARGSTPVVLTPVAVPTAAVSLTYDGTVKTGVLPGTGYALTGNTATDAGSYTATATLAAGYCWVGGATAAQEIPWVIAKAANVWTVAPSVSPNAWSEGETAGQLTAAATQFGVPTATIAKDGGAAAAFTGDLPTAAGSYVITYTSAATDNWDAPTPTTKTAAFMITAAAHVHAWGAWKVITPATATATGLRRRTCSASGCEIGYQDEVIPMITLPLDYVAVDYVQSTLATQYVDTGVSVQDKLSCLVDVEYLSFPEKGSYMLAANSKSSSSSWENRAYLVSATSAGQWRIGIGGKTTTVPTANIPAASVGHRYVVQTSLNGKTGATTVTDATTGTTASYSTTYSAAIKTPYEPKNLGLFALNTSSWSYPSHAKLYACHIWTNNGETLVRSYLPAFKPATETYGLYDTVSGQFFPSESGVPFEGPAQLTAEVPAAAQGLVYTGLEQTGVAAGTGYTLTGDASAVHAGTYTVTATLKVGYKWSDNTLADKTITWTIAQAVNQWTVQPSVSPTSFVAGSDVTVVPGAALFGDVTANYDAATVKLLNAGIYTLDSSVTGTDDYTGLAKSVPFTVGTALISVPVPKANGVQVYDGTEKTGVPAGTGYTLTDATATAVGEYVATATLAAGYCWEGGSTDAVSIPWKIETAAYAQRYEWLLTDARGYILTDYIPNVKRTIVEMTLRVFDIGHDNGLWCASRYTTGSGTEYGNYFQAYYTTDDDVSYEINGDNSLYVPITTAHTNAPVVIRSCGSFFEVDGTTRQLSYDQSDEAASGPLCLFAWAYPRNNVVKYNYQRQKKVYAVKVWEISPDGVTTNLVKNWVPAVSTSGAATLYDTLSNTCLTPTAGDGFVCGNDSELNVVPVPTAATGLVYTGTEQTGVPSGAGYTITGNRQTVAGEYVATATLAAGCCWEGGSTAATNIAWSIAKATNRWTAEPTMTPTSFVVGSDVTIDLGGAAFGDVTANYDAAAVKGLAAGTYELTATVAETVNYTGLTKSIPFTVTKAATAIAVPTAVTGLFEDGTAKTGVLPGVGYTLDGHVAITSAVYTATATLEAGYCWADGSVGPALITWQIAAPSYRSRHDWLLTDKVGYIMTDYIPNVKRTIVEATVSIPEIECCNALWCASRYTTGSGEEFGNYFQVNFTGETGWSDVTLEVLDKDGYIQIDDSIVNRPVVVRTQGVRLDLDGKTVTLEREDVDVAASGPLCLFAWAYPRNNVIKYNYQREKKVYSVKVWEISPDGVTTNLVKNWVPAVSTSGAATLYDTISNTCLTPTNGKGFICGDDSANIVRIPTAASGNVYDGTPKTGIPLGTGYTVAGNVATNAGNYVATVTLDAGYTWLSGGTDAKYIAWSIQRAPNGWKTEPSMTPTTFEKGTDVTLVTGEPLFGTPVANYTAAEVKMLDENDYTFRVTVDGTENYAGLTNEIPFKVASASTEIAVPTAVSGLVYDGSEKVGVPSGTGYTLAGDFVGTEAGSYTATATLESGFVWADGTAGKKSIEWSIAQAENSWKTAPSISRCEWTKGATPGVLTPGVPQFGSASAVIATNGGEPQPFDGTMPTEPGTYVVTYEVPEGSWRAIASSVTFAIAAPVVRPGFDDAHTFVFYGDSLTEGDDAAEVVTADARGNFFDGRFAGQSVKASFPYELSALVPTNYNILAQAESGQKTRELAAWTGRMNYRTAKAFTLPAASGVRVKLEADTLVYTVNGATQSVSSWWPSLPLMESPAGGGTLVGTLGDVRVRLTYDDDDWSYSVERLNTGAAVEVATGTPFVPDNLPVYGDAVQIFFAGANDGAANAAIYLQTLENIVTNIPSGRYLVMSPHCNVTQTGESQDQTTPTAVEQAFAAKFGDKYLNMRLALVTNGVNIAHQLGYTGVTKWNNHNNTTGLLAADKTVHYNPTGNKVVAQIVNAKLCALAYIADPNPPRVDLRGLFPENIKSIYLVAPSSLPTKQDMIDFTNSIIKAGYQVKVAASVWEKQTAVQKAREIETAWQDPETDLILCARGGSGSYDVLTNLNFSILTATNKPFMGFSNISTLLCGMSDRGVKRMIAGPLASSLTTYPHTESTIQRTHDVVAGTDLADSQLTVRRAPTETVVGKPFGGHVPSICSMRDGWAPDTSGRILFLEFNNSRDYDGAVYCVDLMASRGWFENPVAVVLCDMGIDGTAAEKENLRTYITSKVTCPVFSGYPFGHVKELFALDFDRELSISPTGLLKWSGSEPPVEPAYKELRNSLVTDGTGYFITDYVPNLKRTIVEMTVSVPELAKDSALFCANVYTAGGGTKGKDYEYGDYFQCYFNDASGVSYEIQWDDEFGVPVASGKTNVPIVVRACANRLEADGGVSEHAMTLEDKSASGPLCLFAWFYGRKSGGSYRIEYLRQKRVYSVKVWEIDENNAAKTNLVMDLVPALSKQDVKTLYDKVSNTCLTPVSGGGFTFGELCVNATTGVKYETLDAALAAAKPNETVRITDEPTEAVDVTAKAGVAIVNPYPAKVTVKAPATWFDVRQDGTTYTIALNAEATPGVSTDPENPGLEVQDGQLTIRLSNQKPDLYYTLLTAPTPSTPAEQWQPLSTGYEHEKDEFTVDMTTAPSGYYKPAVKDVP